MNNPFFFFWLFVTSESPESLQVVFGNHKNHDYVVKILQMIPLWLVFLMQPKHSFLQGQRKSEQKERGGDYRPKTLVPRAKSYPIIT